MSWLTGKLSDVITGTLNDWVEEFMNFLLSWINKLVFSLPSNKFATTTVNFFIWFASIFAIVIVLYKIIEYIINTQNGTQQYPLDEILLRVVKSAGGMLVLPWILKFVFVDIALPIANYFAAAGTDFNGKGGFKAIESALMAAQLGISGGGIVLLVLLIFFLFAFLMFLYSVCVFYADFIIMQILTAPVALSMIADDNNYFQVWWRELLSQVTSLLIKLFLVTLVINILFTGGNIMLAIGAGALIIKTPSVLKNMWYGGGGTRGISRGAGSAVSMSSRMLLTKFLK
ncbi:conjugal transfer protein TrbL family protein [Heyndrickxia camelliae]|uniref:Uncharacterized protein n=1 Tax=Heyndrickxia camelliae TaxID=1707093 RepID=A0A2N3LER4_9BACI|nr:conjugal transfer protein TrbL family protein [Heyndrickxia camelliae]PKR83043.1 hypothetical protein CWO92_21130 [Heyndrickxia camelliae]